MALYLGSEKIAGFLPETVYYIDDNGWTVINHGVYKEYLKFVSFEITLNGNSWGTQKISNMPVGISSLGNRFLTGTGACGDAALSFNIECNKASSDIYIKTKNQYSSQLSRSASATLRILEIPELL